MKNKIFNFLNKKYHNIYHDYYIILTPLELLKMYLCSHTKYEKNFLVTNNEKKLKKNIYSFFSNQILKIFFKI
ncbi:MAG: hypothetical protein EAZ59_29045 [Oscillatoriales cyanobacterium]|nr:MAG: hypothetical protein EAZ59_29045 [Oscillatoriales cyanobacterium]